MSHSILWRRLDLPGHESARLYSADSRQHLTGTAAFLHDHQPCRLDYLVVCDSEWRTLSTRVAGWVGDEEVAIEVVADPAGHWQLNGVAQPAVAGCIDIDLGFSPSTNLLPIRRLNLQVGQQAKVRAAWLRFPGFAFESLDQIYRRLDHNTFRYESGGGRFVRDLEVNEAGFVTLYPDFWELEGNSHQVSP